MLTGEHILTTAFWFSVWVSAAVGLVGVAFLVWGVIVRVKKPWDDNYSLPNLPISLAWGAGAVVCFAIVILGWFPYDMQYHGRSVVEGTVQQVDSRLLPSGKAMEEKFVITFQESGNQFGCTDTRCAALVPGDRVRLLCTKTYDWNSTDGWDCGWGSRK